MSLKGQDIRADLNKCYTQFIRLKNYSSTVKVDIYKKDTDTKPFMTIKGELRKSDKKYFSHMNKATLLLNDKCMISIDEGVRYVYYRNINNEHDKTVLQKNDFDPANMSKMIDSTLTKSEEILYNGESNGLKCYFIKSRALIYLTEVYLDVKTGMIRKLVYYYNKKVMKENNKVIIEFINTDLSPVFDQQAFSEDQFVSVTGNKVTPIGRYKGFDVIKDMPKNKK